MPTNWNELNHDHTITGTWVDEASAVTPLQINQLQPMYLTNGGVTITEAMMEEYVSLKLAKRLEEGTFMGWLKGRGE